MITAESSQGKALLTLVLSAFVIACSGVQGNWSHWSGDLNNRRFSDHACINFKAGKLTQKWKYTTGGSVLATPTVCGGGVFFVDNSVAITRLDLNGKLKWRVLASSLGIPGRVGIRSSPIMSPDCKQLYTFTQWTKGSWIIALNALTGKKIYAKLLDSQPMARVTQSGVMWNGLLYIGMSSMSEGAQTSGTTFRGSLSAVVAKTGKVKWRRYMCPGQGYTGCAVWGSSPSIDVRRKQVCVGTGNNYEVPANVAQCVKNSGNNFGTQRLCVPEPIRKINFNDAVVCMDFNTGAVKWAKNLHGVDMYLPGAYMGLDQDFAQGLITIHKGNPADDILIGTPKSGITTAYSPATGQVKWSSGVIEAGGYSMFGSCTNNKAYCMALFWYGQKKAVVTCMDALTGKRISQWRTNEGGVYGPLTCTQNFVFVPLFNQPGSLVALEIASGQEMGRFNTGQTLFCGPAIVNGVAYVGSGYPANGGMNNKAIYGVKLPGC